MHIPGRTSASSTGSWIWHLCLWFPDSPAGLQGRERCDKGFSLLFFRHGHVTIAQNALGIRGSNSSKTLSHLSSSLHLENGVFPQRHLFYSHPGMKAVDLMVSSSQVCEGLLSCHGHGCTQQQSWCKTCWEDGRKEADRLKTGTASQTLWSISSKEPPKESKIEKSSKGTSENNVKAQRSKGLLKTSNVLFTSTTKRQNIWIS